MGITEDILGRIVPQFFRPCLLKILTCVSLREQKACTFFAQKRLKHLYVNVFRFNQPAIINNTYNLVKQKYY